MSFGVVLFDDPNNPSMGLCAVDGSIDRISSASDLDTGVMWWTNVPYAVFEKQLSRFPNLRNDQLLRARMSVIAEEFGVATLNNDEQAEFFCELVNRVAEFTKAHTGIDVSNMVRLDWSLKGHLLQTARRFNGDLTELGNAARDAHVYLAASSMSTNDSEAVRTYTAPRLTLAEKILSLPFPSLKGTWNVIDFPTPVRLDPKALPPELVGVGGFLKLNMRRMSAERADFAPFTRRAGYRSTKNRTWAAIPEALSYAEDAEVYVSRAWVTELAPLDLKIPLPSNEAFQFSLSASLLAEAYLFALGAMPATGYSSGLEAIAAYVWAYERSFLVDIARTIYRENANPISTGSLKVVVSVRHADVARIDKTAVDLGLEVPMSLKGVA